MKEGYSIAFREFCILCAKPEELTEVLKVCDERLVAGPVTHQGFGDHTYVFPGDTKKRELMVTTCAGMGHVQAAVRTAQILTRHSPAVMAFVGTAASIRPEVVQLGDVVIPRKVMLRSYDKISEKGQRDFENRVKRAGFKERFFDENALIADTDSLVFNEDAQSLIAPLLGAPPALERGEGDKVEVGGTAYPLRNPKLHVDVDIFSCGMVVDSVSYRDFILGMSEDVLRKAVAIDMESFGFLRAVEETRKSHDCDALMIRGVSDYAGRKQQTEAGAGDVRPGGWKEKASRNAALVAVELFALLAERDNRRS